MKTRLIPASQIILSEPVEDRWGDSKVKDDVLTKSIATGGVQTPLNVIETAPNEFRLVKGSRRLGACKALGIVKVPCMVSPLPKGANLEDYIRRIRFIVSEHRQDLLPTQKAALIVRQKSDLGLNNSQLAAYLGVDADSITNWLAPLKYIEPVKSAMDTGALTMQNARVFDGLTEFGQATIWRKHLKELTVDGAGGVHRRIRSQYPPEHYPAFYANPEATAARLSRTAKARRRTKKRPVTSTDEKRKLMGSVELREAELVELQVEAKELKAACIAAGPVVSAILRNKKLRDLIPRDSGMIAELERFSEIY